MIGYWHDDVLCLSVPLSVTLCIVAKQYILRQKCLNKWTGSASLGTLLYNFQPPKPSPFPQTTLLLNHMPYVEYIKEDIVNNWTAKICTSGLAADAYSRERSAAIYHIRIRSTFVFPSLGLLLSIIANLLCIVLGKATEQ